MSDIADSIYNIRFLEESAQRDSIIHKVNPTAKIVVTLAFIIAVLSFGKYELSGLIPFVFYPIIVCTLGDIHITAVFKRVLPVMPFVAGVGIFNVFYDKNLLYIILGIGITGGIVSFLSLVFKCILVVCAGVLLAASTGIEKISSSLAGMGVPRILVLQIMMTYRYISLLLEEVGRIQDAYMLRAPFQNGIDMKFWGSLPGHLLIKSYERAGRIYSAMQARGFDPENIIIEPTSFKISDLFYIAVWTGFFLLARMFNLPDTLGKIITGA
jgi:cobalt/nickel transport system permease protein